MNIRDTFDNDRGTFYLAITRIILGLMCIYGFLDKMFGLRVSTPQAAFINGGSPTHGYIAHAADGPLGFLFEPLANVPMFMDIIIMTSLLLLGISLTLGIGRKLGCVLGAVMMFLFYISSFPIAEHPFLDMHLIYVFLLLAFYHTNAYSVLGLEDLWKGTSIVKRFGILE